MFGLDADITVGRERLEPVAGEGSLWESVECQRVVKGRGFGNGGDRIGPTGGGDRAKVPSGWRSARAIT